jgi:hypothetical protein
MSYLSGLGTSVYGSSVGPGLSSVSQAIQGFLQNQRFWAQMEEQRREREKDRKHQEKQQKKAEKEAGKGKLGGAGAGAGAGALTGFLASGFNPVGAIVGGGIGGLGGYGSGSVEGGLTTGAISGLGAGLGAAAPALTGFTPALSQAGATASSVGTSSLGAAAGSGVSGAVADPTVVARYGPSYAGGGGPTPTALAPQAPQAAPGKFLGGTANQWKGAAAGALMPGAMVGYAMSPYSQYLRDRTALTQQRFGQQQGRDAWNRRMDVTREGRQQEELGFRRASAGRDATRFGRETEAHEYGLSTRPTPEQIATDRARGIRQDEAGIASTEALTKKRRSDAFMTGPIGRGGKWLAGLVEDAGSRLGDLAEQGIGARQPTTATRGFDALTKRAGYSPEQARQAAALKVPTSQPATPARPLDPTKAARLALDAKNQLAPIGGPDVPGVSGAISEQEFNNLIREGANLETRPSPEVELEAALKYAGDQGSSKEYAEGIVWSMYNEGRISETVRDDWLRRINQSNARG